MIDKASNLQFPYLFLSWNLPIDIVIPKSAKEKENVIFKTNSSKNKLPREVQNGYTLRFDD